MNYYVSVIKRHYKYSFKIVINIVIADVIFYR